MSESNFDKLEDRKIYFMSADISFIKNNIFTGKKKLTSLELKQSADSVLLLSEER